MAKTSPDSESPRSRLTFCPLQVAGDPPSEDLGANQAQLVKSEGGLQRLTASAFADQAKLVYALDSLGRVTGVTSPNGNQEDLDAIVLEGAKNALFNPSGQINAPYDLDSWDDPLGTVAPRHWTPNAAATREVEASGQAYFPLNTTVDTWEQRQIPVSAGARYLTHFAVRKEDDAGGTTTARLEFQHRLHKC